MKQEQTLRTKPNQTKSLSSGNFNILRILGEGSYAEVYEAQQVDNSKRIVLKKIFKDSIVKQEKENDVYMERSILITYANKHRGMIKFYGSFQDDQYLYFIMEYCPYGDLGFFIKQISSLKKLGSKLDTMLLLIKMYIYQIVLILNFFHENGIAHLDIKPQNLVIDSELNLKIIDFGTCFFFEPSKIPEEVQLPQQNKKIKKRSASLENEDTEIGSPTLRSQFVGTTEYLSPEMLEFSCASKEADIWALGCIIYEMYYGVQPFHAESENVVFSKIIQNDYCFHPDSNFPVSNDTLDLIFRQIINSQQKFSLLRPEPQDRLGSKNTLEILGHPFFNQLKEINYEPWKSPIQKYSEFADIFTLIRNKQQLQIMKNSIVQIPRESNINNDEQTTFSIQQLPFIPQNNVIAQGFIKVEGMRFFCFCKIGLMTVYYKKQSVEIDFLQKGKKSVKKYNAKQIELKFDKKKQRYRLRSGEETLFYKNMEALSIDWIGVINKLLNYS